MTRFPYRAGDAVAICDLCGLKWFHSQLVKNWRGQMVCPRDYEPRHPQDFVRAVPDGKSIKDARPPGPDKFLEPGEVKESDL